MHSTLVLTTRYLTAIGVTGFLWDYALMFDEEKTHIWSRSRWTTTQCAFVLKRYSTFVGLIYAAFLTSGLQSPMSAFVSRLFPALIPEGLTQLQSCKVSYITVTALAGIATLASYGWTALRLVVLWDQKPSAKTVLWILSAMTFIGISVSFLISAPEIFEHVTYLPPPINMCALSRNPPAFTGIWISMICFDIATVLLVITNALHQPYKRSSQIADRIKRDGAWTFVLVFAASIGMFTVSVTGPPGSIYEATMFFWALDTVIECRLAIRTVQFTKSNSTPIGVHETDNVLEGLARSTSRESDATWLHP